MAESDIQHALALAVQHLQAGRLAEAERLCRQILMQQPRHALAMHHLGMIALQVGRIDEGMDLIRRSLELDPSYPDGHSNLAIALQRKGKFDEAIASSRRAIALKPGFPEAYFNLGNALLAKRQLDDAAAAFRQAIILRPNYAGAYGNLAAALQTQGKLDEAIASYQKAISLQPNYLDAYYNLGIALKEKGRIDEAISACRTAIAQRPDFPDAYLNLGSALLAKDQQDEAIAAFRRAIALRPNYAEAHSNLATALKDKGELDEAIAAYRQSIALAPDLTGARNNLIYAFYFHPASNARAIAEEQRKENRGLVEPLKPHFMPHANDRDPDRRLRIGYVSPDFRAHPVGRFLLPLFENHDHQRFEVFAYDNVPPVGIDDMTRRLRSHTDAWRRIADLPDERAAEMIREDRIDILVDLTLHMANSRLPIFARKPAPVQVTYLAYAGSSGLSTIDYRLSDPYLDPVGEDESIYSEQTIRLPETYWCYAPPVEVPLVPPPLLAKGFVTFGCLNNFCKVNEPLLQIWARLLGGVPESRLILHAHEGSHRQRVLNTFQKAGIEPARISFAGKMPVNAYFQTYQSIDIALDTFPYGGGTTTCDALWMGVPTISLKGNMAVGRGGFSILSNAGLSEWVARTPEQYVNLAAKLAGDVPRLTALRSTVRRRMESSALMDAPRFARNFEEACRLMWRSWAGKTPAIMSH